MCGFFLCGYSYGRGDVVDDGDAADARGGGHDSDAGRRHRRHSRRHNTALLHGHFHRLQNSVSCCSFTFFFYYSL